MSIQQIQLVSQAIGMPGYLLERLTERKLVYREIEQALTNVAEMCPGYPMDDCLFEVLKFNGRLNLNETVSEPEEQLRFIAFHALCHRCSIDNLMIVWDAFCEHSPSAERIFVARTVLAQVVPDALSYYRLYQPFYCIQALAYFGIPLEPGTVMYNGSPWYCLVRPQKDSYTPNTEKLESLQTLWERNRCPFKALCVVNGDTFIVLDSAINDWNPVQLPSGFKTMREANRPMYNKL